jgi:uncharacterized protein
VAYQTDLLDKELKRKGKQDETVRLETLKRVSSVLDALSVEISFDEAYIFGSLTKPYRFLRDSDIDLAFTGLEDEDFFRVMAHISRQTGFDIDVIQLEGHRLAEKIRREGLRWTREA